MFDMNNIHFRASKACQHWCRRAAGYWGEGRECNLRLPQGAAGHDDGARGQPGPYLSGLTYLQREAWTPNIFYA